MAFSVSYIYRILDRYSRPLKQLQKQNRIFEKSLASVQKRLSGVTTGSQQFSANMQGSSAISADLSSRLDRMAYYMRQNYRASTRTSKAVRNLSTNMNMAAKSMSKVKNKTKEVNRGLKSMLVKAEGAGKTLANLRSGAVLLAGGAGIGFGIKKLMEYEDAFADVRRVSSFTDEQFSKFKETMIGMGQEMRISADGLAEIAFQGKKFGVLEKDLLTFTSGVFKASRAFDMTEEEAGAMFGSVMSGMNFSIRQALTFTDSVNFIADNFKAQGSAIINIADRLQGQFLQLELPPKVAAGWAGFLNVVEKRPELAATRFEAMLTTFADAKKLRKIGRFVPNFADLMAKDPDQAMQKLLKSLAKLPKETRKFKIHKLFGDIPAKLITKMTGQIGKLDKVMQAALGEKAVGSMDREFRNYLNRISTDLKGIVVIIGNVTESLSVLFRPELKAFANRMREIGLSIREWVKENPKIAKLIVYFGMGGVALTALVVGLGLFMLALSSAVKGILLVKNATILWAGAMKIVSIVMAASPIVWIPALIAIVIAAIILMVKHWDTVVEVLKKVWEWLLQFKIVQDIVEMFTLAFNDIKTIITGFWNWLRNTRVFKWLSKIFKDDVNITVRGPNPPINTEINRRLAVDEASRRAGGERMDINGNIRVRADQGTVVEQVEIYSSRNGSNLAEVGGM